MTERVRLTLYVRVGCSLCEAMEAELAGLRARFPFELAIVDIDADPVLAARYNTMVPVLAAPERELCHYFLDPDALRRYFAAD